MSDTTAGQDGTGSLSTCFCSCMPIARLSGESLLLSFIKGKLRGCFQTLRGSSLERPVHRQYTVRNKHEVLQMRQDIISASQIILIVPEDVSGLLDFALDFQRRQTSSLSPELRTQFSRLPIWNCVKGSGPTTLAKVSFYSAGKLVPLIQLSRVFPRMDDSDAIDVFPQEVRNNLNAPIRTGNRRPTQRLVVGSYQLVPDSRPSTR